MRAPISKNCSTDRGRKKFSRRSTIWTKPAPRWQRQADARPHEGTRRQGVVSRQALDDATAKFECDQQRVNSLEKGFNWRRSARAPRRSPAPRARSCRRRAKLDYAKSQLDATVIRAPVTGTILDRTAEKGELITAQFASAAAGGPQGSVVSLADLNDLQVELDIAQDDFARLGPNAKGDCHHRRVSRQEIRRRDRANFSRSEPAEGDGAGEGAGAESGQVSRRSAAAGDERDREVPGQ